MTTFTNFSQTRFTTFNIFKTMKNIFFTTLFLSVFTLFAQTANAQTAADEAAIKTMWKETWEAYDAGNLEKMWAAYTDGAAEIGPDGSLTTGKKAMREGYEAFMKMVDAPPKFTYESPAVRVLTPEFAILTWDSSADIKIGGQQVGGKTKGMALVRKIKRQWKIEFDALTPVMEMPAEAGKGN